MGHVARISALALLVTSCASMAAPPGTRFNIPLSDTGRWGTVMVSVDGASEPQRMVFDTAAGGHVIDRAAAERLDLLRSATAAGGTVVGANGTAEGGQRVAVRRMRMGDLDEVDTGFLVFDLRQFSRRGTRIDGIVGNPLLARYSMIFDVPSGRLTLSSTAEPQLDEGFTCQPNAAGLNRPPELANFPIVQVQAGLSASSAVPITAIVDTGASGTVINWPAAHALGIREGNPGLRPSGGGGGLDGNQAPTSFRYTLPRLRVGEHTFSNVNVTISSLPVFQATRLQDRPAMILGMTSFRVQPVATDRGVNRICFGRVVSPPTATTG